MKQIRNFESDLLRASSMLENEGGTLRYCLNLGEMFRDSTILSSIAEVIDRRNSAVFNTIMRVQESLSREEKGATVTPIK